MSDYLPHVERLLATATTPNGTRLLIGGERDVRDSTVSGLHVLQLPRLEPLARLEVPSAVCAISCLDDQRALVRVDPGRTHTSTGHELTVGLDGQTLYLPPGTTLSPAVPTFVVTS